MGMPTSKGDHRDAPENVRGQSRVHYGDEQNRRYRRGDDERKPLELLTLHASGPPEAKRQREQCRCEARGKERCARYPNPVEQAFHVDADGVGEPSGERIGVKSFRQDDEHRPDRSQPHGEAPPRRERSALREEEQEDGAEPERGPDSPFVHPREHLRYRQRPRLGRDGLRRGLGDAVDGPDEREAAHQPADGVLRPASGHERAGRREHGEPEVTENREPERRDVNQRRDVSLRRRRDTVDDESDPEPGEGEVQRPEGPGEAGCCARAHVRLSGDRNQTETCAGCNVPCTTSRSSPLIASRSISSRRRPAKLSRVRPAS